MEQSDDLMFSTNRFEAEFSATETKIKPEIDFEGNLISADIPLNYTLSNAGFDAKKISKEALPNVKECVVLRNVLTAEECQGLQTACFGDRSETALASHPVLWRKWSSTPEKEYAKLGIRAIRSSNQVANALWERVKQYAPQHVDVKSKSTGKTQRWEVMPCGLHDRQRFVIYEPGQSFPPHSDAPRVIDDQTRSFYTILFYLGKSGSLLEREKDFRGGELSLLHGDPITHKTQTLHTITPECGMVVIFPHMQLHEGKSLKSGLKCAIRNDIMYRLVDGPEGEPLEEPTGFAVEEGQH